MSKYLDIHTHTYKSAHDIIDIISLDPRKELSHSSCKYSWGVHPWYINEFSKDDIKEKIKKIIKHENFFSLGEIGLDKASKIDFLKQIEYFEFQLSLCSEFNIPIITIHNVRSFNEIYTSLKKCDFKGAIIFHDFRGNLETYNQFSKSFKTYVSFNAERLELEKVQDTLKLLPINHIFFETDESIISIKTAYKLASSTLGIGEEELVKQILDNYKKLKLL